MTNGEKFEEVFGKKNWFDEEYVEPKPKPEPDTTPEPSYEEVRHLLTRCLVEHLDEIGKAHEEGKYREMRDQTNTCLYIVDLLEKLEKLSQE